MGMQIHFNNDDIPEAAETTIHYDAKSDTKSIKIVHDRQMLVANYNEFGNWFDCGAGDYWQLRNIKTLISWRIPFTAS